MRRLYGFGLIALSLAIAAPAQAADPAIGDRVEYFESGWWKATVVAIGSGANAGQIKVRADGSAFDNWASAKNVRPLPGAAAGANQAGSTPATKPGGVIASAPRTGDYDIFSYGPRNRLRLGHLNLSGGGRYKFYNNGAQLLGEGTYTYAAGEVTWKSGILLQQKWGGGFTVEANGRDHIIRLKSGTIAVNSK